MPVDSIQCVVEQGSNITPIIIGVSGFFASGFAGWSIYSARNIAKKKAAIDLMERSIENIVLTKATEKVRKIHLDSNIEIAVFAYGKKPDNHENDGFVRDRDAIRKVLNFHEHMAVGIKNNIYDEKVLKEQRYTSTVELWKMIESFVLKRREITKSDTLYQEFEVLAKKWKKNKLEVISD